MMKLSEYKLETLHQDGSVTLGGPDALRVARNGLRGNRRFKPHFYIGWKNSVSMSGNFEVVSAVSAPSLG